MSQAQLADASAKGDGDIATDRMKQATGGQRSAGQKYEHTLRHALILAVDLDLWDKARMLGIATRPLATWHGHHMKKLRSVGAVQTAYVDLVGGGLAVLLREWVGALDDTVALEECGLVMSCQRSKLHALSKLSPEVVCRDSLASEMFAYFLKLVKYRCLSGVHHTIGYPGHLAGLLHDRQSYREHFGKTLNQHLDDFEALKQRPERAAAKIAERSTTHLPIMRVCAAMRERFLGVVPEPLRQYVALIFQGWGQTRCKQVGSAGGNIGAEQQADPKSEATGSASP